MPTPAYIKITGATQGNITQGASSEESIGNTWQEGHEDQILVQAIDHIVTIPRDPQSGQPSGQRVHRPLKFVSALNKATPLLYNALTSGEMLTTVEIDWYRTNTSGKQEHYFTTTLTDATIVDIDLKMPNAQDPVMAPFTQLVTVSLAYRKVAWEHKIAGTSGADDWRQPKA